MGRKKKRKEVPVDTQSAPSIVSASTALDPSSFQNTGVSSVNEIQKESSKRVKIEEVIHANVAAYEKEKLQQPQQQQQQQVDDINLLYDDAVLPGSTAAITAGKTAARLVQESEEDRVESILQLTSDGNKGEKLSSNYSIHEASGEYEPLDVYVSDGSEDEHDFEIILTNSKHGVMRRGGFLSSMVQNKQWIRFDNELEAGKEAAKIKEAEEENLDPSVKAARELAEKKRQLEKAKEEARRKESAENAGRDPCLFSKRTAFDIRMDHIEDKPWERGDIVDFFNYGLGEEDWIEYAERQLSVRQELTDAVKQKRQPDPNIVPVVPTAPSKQTPRVAVRETKKNEDSLSGDNDRIGGGTIGPVVPLQCTVIPEAKSSNNALEEDDDIGAETIGGAWGGNAKPGSVLAKLIEEQEKALEAADVTKEDTDALPSSRSQPRLDEYDDASKKPYNGFPGAAQTQSGRTTYKRDNSNYSARPPLPPPPPIHGNDNYRQQPYGGPPPPIHGNDNYRQQPYGGPPPPIHESDNYRRQPYGGPPHSYGSNMGRGYPGRGYGRGRGRSHGRGRGRGRGYGRGNEQFGRGIPQEPRKRMREDNYFRGPTHEYDHRGGRY